MRPRLLLLFLTVWAWSIANPVAADATGRWKVTISANQHPLDGVVDGNRITLTTHPRPGRTVAFAKCQLTMDGDRMSGTTEGGDLGGKATIELTRDNK